MKKITSLLALLLLSSVVAGAQDLITRKNGTDIVAKVLEVGISAGYLLHRFHAAGREFAHFHRQAPEGPENSRGRDSEGGKFLRRAV